MDNFDLKKSVMMTSRDLSLLKSLYDSVVMSFLQIARMHFVDRSKPTIINRMTKLERSGLIIRLKVPRLEITNSKKMISVVYQITRLGISVLQKSHPELELRPEPIKLRPFSVDHDLLLVDVIESLKLKVKDFKIIHGELYLSHASSNGLKPDAVLIDLNRTQKIAIELELTVKSEKRYRDLLLKYRLTKDFSKVIYITSHKQIESKIKSVLGSGIGKDRFQFLTLDEVLKTTHLTAVNNSNVDTDTSIQPKAEEGGQL